MPKKTRKRSNRKADDNVSYSVEILDKDVSYYFALPPRDDIVPGPYWEQMEIKLAGKLLEPEALKDRLITVSLLGDRGLVQALERPENCRNEPIGVGHFNLRGKESAFYGSVPFDALVFLYSLLKDEKIKFISMSAPTLFRGESFVKSMLFAEAI